MNLEPMPRPDGAPFRCSAITHWEGKQPNYHPVYCSQEPAGLYPKDEWFGNERVRNVLSSGRVTCTHHAFFAEVAGRSAQEAIDTLGGK